MTVVAPSAKAVKQAIQWLLRLRESGSSPALLQQCEQWRSARHEHELAWQRVIHLHQDLDLRTIPGAGVALHTLETSQRRLHRRQALKLLGGVALVGSATWLARDLDSVSAWASDYATATGERRRLHLPDGSLMQLNTRSAVDLAFDQQQRLVHLKQGELMLTCSEAQDQTRPCWYRRKRPCSKVSMLALWYARISPAPASASARERWRYTGRGMARCNGSTAASTGAWMPAVHNASIAWIWTPRPGAKG